MSILLYILGAVCIFGGPMAVIMSGPPWLLLSVPVGIALTAAGIVRYCRQHPLPDERDIYIPAAPAREAPAERKMSDEKMSDEKMSLKEDIRMDKNTEKAEAAAPVTSDTDVYLGQILKRLEKIEFEARETRRQTTITAEAVKLMILLAVIAGIVGVVSGLAATADPEMGMVVLGLGVLVWVIVLISGYSDLKKIT